MIVAFSFCQHDRTMALEMARHIECLGSVSRHRALILHPSDVDGDEIGRHLKPVFGSVMDIAYAPRLNGWPDGPNQCFFEAAKTIQALAGDEPWLWLEADCVPTRPIWLDEIAAEYRLCGLPILGALCDTFGLDGKVTSQHVTGVAVYPHDLLKRCPSLKFIVETTEAYRRQGYCPPAFDTYLEGYTVKMCAPVRSMRHYWKSFGYEEKEGVVRCKFQSPYGIGDEVDMNAALIHGAKDFSLLNLVQERLAGVVA